MTMKLSPLDYIIIFVLMIVAGLIFFFISNEVIVTVGTDGNISEVAHVKKSLFSSPKVKVGDKFKTEKVAKKAGE